MTERDVDDVMARDPLLEDPLGLLGQRSTGRAAVGVVLVGMCLVGLLTAVALAGIRGRERSDLQAGLEAQVFAARNALDLWAGEQQRTAQSWAAEPEVVAATERLLVADDPLSAPAQEDLRTHLATALGLDGYLGFFVVAPDGTSLASTRDANTGTPNLVATEAPDRFARILDGEALLTLPQVTDVPIPDGTGEISTVLTMFTGAPVLAPDGEVIAAFLFRIDVPNEFSQLFHAQRRRLTDDVFAFGSDGRFLVEPRDADRLTALHGDDSDFWNYEVVPPDSGGALTEMAAAAVAGRDGADTDGYRNHVGDQVYGAWVWSDDYGLGIAAEATSAELLVQWRAVRNLVLALGVSLVAVLAGLGWYFGWVRPAKDLQRELASERARRLRTLIDQSSDGICVVAPDHRVVMVNRSMTELFGLESIDLASLEVGDLVAPGVRSDHRALVDGFLASYRPGGVMASRSRQVEAARADGSRFPVEVTLSRIEIDDGEVVLASVRDLSTDLRAIQLDQSLRELERLTAVAAHDLKEPLRKVGSLCNLLSTTNGDDPTVDRLQAAADRARSLVDDLATYIEWSTRESDLRTVDLAALVDEVLASFQPTIAELDADVVVGTLPIVHGDEQELRTLFVELIENSLTFCTAAPKLGIGTRPSGRNDMERITVEDNGLGIPAADADRAFEAFRTFGRRTSDAEAGAPGNGIGLAICRRIVERHNGSIALVDTGDGVTVTIDLPTAQRLAPAGTPDVELERTPS